MMTTTFYEVCYYDANGAVALITYRMTTGFIIIFTLLLA